MSLVTPERWYIAFWLAVGLGALILNAVLTRYAIISALTSLGR